MKIQVSKAYSLLLFEAPLIAVNSVERHQRLYDGDIEKDIKGEEISVEILENYSPHKEINEAFKTKSCEAFSDAI